MSDGSSSGLVRLVGWPAPLFHGDTGVLDRWLWLRRRLPRAGEPRHLIDVGYGTGGFTIGAARRGYHSLGLSWDVRNQAVAAHRAALCRAGLARFEVLDVRHLDRRTDYASSFDVALLCEVVEHVLDDAKLVRDVAACLRPEGKLLVTTPNLHLRPIDPSHAGPFSTMEDGGHVRRGYTEARLRALCDQAGLVVEEVSYCTGFISQMACRIYFRLGKIHPRFGWLVVHPLRPLPPLLDPIVTRIARWPFYSICVVARKPT